MEWGEHAQWIEVRGRFQMVSIGGTVFTKNKCRTPSWWCQMRLESSCCPSVITRHDYPHKHP